MDFTYLHGKMTLRVISPIAENFPELSVRKEINRVAIFVLTAYLSIKLLQTSFHCLGPFILILFGM